MTTEVSNLAPGETPRRKLTHSDVSTIISRDRTHEWNDFFTTFYGKFAIYFESIEFVDDICLYSPSNIIHQIVFKDCLIKNLENSDISTLECIHFINCTIDEDVKISNVKITGIKCIFKSSIFNKSLFLENCNIEALLIFENNTIIGDFYLQNCETHNDIIIQSGAFNSWLCFRNNIIHKNITIKEGLFKGIVSLNNNKFLSPIKINGGKFANTLEVNESFFEKDIIVSGGSISKLMIKNISSKFLLNVQHTSKIDFILFYGIIYKDSILTINNVFFLINFNNVQNFGSIQFNGVYAKSDPEVSILSGLHLDIPRTPTIELLNSDLGKITFIDCNLSGFSLNFRSSKLTDFFVTGTKMPRHIQSDDRSQKQLGYSQIKKIYEARGDRIEANRYFAKEMEAYLSTLTWSQDFWEKINLLCNKYSTNYGQSWQRGFLSTMLVSIVFYIVYAFSLGFYPDWLTVTSWIRLPIPLPIPNFLVNPNFYLFGKVSSYLLEFINPIHKADYVAEELLGETAKISGFSRMTEGISRIFIAYCVYQLIQAFRKHGKTG